MEKYTSPVFHTKRECRDLFLTLYCAAASTEAESEAPQEGSLYTAFRTLWEQYEGDELQSPICARVLAFYFLMERTRGTVVEEWLRPCTETPEAVFLDDAIVAAIASVSLGESGVLQEDDFLMTVRALARVHADDLETRTEGVKPAITSTHPPALPLTAASLTIGGLAERLLAHEAAAEDLSQGEMSAAFAVCEKLRQPLSALAGKEVFRALLTRALTLSRREIPALKEIRVRDDGSLEGVDCGSIQAGVVLVGHLVRQPAAVIGENLTFCLLREVWPDLASFEEHLPTLSEAERK